MPLTDSEHLRGFDEKHGTAHVLQKDVVDVIGSVTRDAPRSGRQLEGYILCDVSPIGPECGKCKIRNARANRGVAARGDTVRVTK